MQLMGEAAAHNEDPELGRMEHGRCDINLVVVRLLRFLAPHSGRLRHMSAICARTLSNSQATPGPKNSKP
eukprot:8956002-Lingulodinium_polyedra.AAC.1